MEENICLEHSKYEFNILPNTNFKVVIVKMVFTYRNFNVKIFFKTFYFFCDLNLYIKKQNII